MSDQNNAPIVVNPNPWPSQIASAARVVVILLGSLSALVGFLKARDLAGMIAYLQSAEFIPVMGAAAAAGAFVYGQIKLRLDKRDAVTIAHGAADDVAVVKSKGA